MDMVTNLRSTKFPRSVKLLLNAHVMMRRANVLKSYPCKLSLTALICFWGMVEGAVVAVVVERGHPAAWSINLDFKSASCLQLFMGEQKRNEHSSHNTELKGALFLTAACFFWSCFIILQANVLKSYPCKLSLTALICFWGMVEGALVAVVVERGHPAAWSINLDFKLLAAVYGAFLSGAAYYVMGLVGKKKGPVFYSAFNPLTTVLVAILGSVFLAEQLYTGSVIGAVIIVGGLCIVLDLGKGKRLASLRIEGCQCRRTKHKPSIRRSPSLRGVYSI